MMSKIFFILALSVALATSGALANNKSEEGEQYSSPASGHGDYSGGTPTLEGMGGGHGHYYPKPLRTCDKYPKICQAHGSPGPVCCNKCCVDVRTDRLNCGSCGRKCRYSEMCCQGQCVNIMNDPNNCGCCGKKCKKGSACRHGMCNYA